MVDKGDCGTGKQCYAPAGAGKTYTDSECQAQGSGKGQCNDKDPSTATDKYKSIGSCTTKPKLCYVPDSGGGNPLGSGGSSSPTRISFQNPLQFDTFQGFVTSVLSYLQGIIVLLALLFIVIGGVLYITSAGDQKRIETAKGAITYAMIGLAIGIAAPTFLKEIATILGWNGDQTPIAGARGLSDILLKTLDFLLGITGVLGVIMFVIGGMMYLTSGGDDRRIDTSKGILKASAIGVAIVLAALVIVKQIASLLS